MERKETLELAPHPSQSTKETSEFAATPCAHGLLVLAPPSRVLYVNEKARRLLTEKRIPRPDGSDTASRSRLGAVASTIEQTSGRIFHASSSPQLLSNPVEVKGLIDCLGPHLHGHGFLFHDRVHRQWVRAVLVFDRAPPRLSLS